MGGVSIIDCKAKILIIDNPVVIPDERPSPSEGKLLSEYLNNLSPKRKEAMQRARKKIAGSSAGKRMSGLATMRLQAGLSQKQLAEKIDKQQSAIARLERDPTSITFETMKKIARALGRPIGDIANAIDSKTNINTPEMQNG